MKIVSFVNNSEFGWGIVDEQQMRIKTNFKLLNHVTSFEEIIDMSIQYKRNIKILTDEISLDYSALLAPIIPTKNIICVGKNYAEHVLEYDGNNRDIELVKENPVFFTKATSSINEPYGEVPCHSQVTNALDYEAELGVVIGKEGINIEEDFALDYVFGYTVLNDLSARDIQKKHQQWFKGKSLDGCCPVGPWVVTKDEIVNPNNLMIQSFVNDEIRQKASTNQMMHNVKRLISIISKGLTLKPGDVIATGTPSGVGVGFKPPRFLHQGDKVRVEIEGIGFIENIIK